MGKIWKKIGLINLTGYSQGPIFNRRAIFLSNEQVKSDNSPKFLVLSSKFYQVDLAPLGTVISHEQRPIRGCECFVSVDMNLNPGEQAKQAWGLDLPGRNLSGSLVT